MYNWTTKLMIDVMNARIDIRAIAHAMNKDEVWVAALFYGQAKATEEELRALGAVLQLGPRWYPNRGIGPIPPTDPVIYRLFEVTLTGCVTKLRFALQFGDGIMSMIDCKIHIDKKEDPKGDRVVLTFDGKFLPYAKW
ncbi:cyanate hydratase [Russula vinacea]|nr:cyanate hydratase [Russula vinacea]